LPYCVATTGRAQKNDSPSQKKQAIAARLTSDINIDGKLDDAAWATVPLIDNFVNLEPIAGKPASSPTQVRVAYDDAALYIGAFMAEAGGRDSVMTELARRDDFGNTDWFGVFICPYRDGSNGFGFISGATGVQFDAKYSNGGNEDPSWDAVWDAQVALTDKGWSLEMKIPYSALRFPDAAEQVWGINFGRQRRLSGEKSFWNTINPQATGFLTQFGEISGIKDIHPPVRLSATPYASVYAQNHHDKNASPKSTMGYSYNLGMDVKYGLTDAFTLDMTLIPDFGQVQSDDQVLNLSPFEVQFQENRPFFTEGTELFGKGNLFYSRRIGGTPIGFWQAGDQLGANEELVENPSEAQLYNATKLSGRTAKGLGLGVLNAVAAEERATIRDVELGTTRQFVTSPLTNYNVFVLDQNLKNNSSVSLVNTNVWRSGNQYHDANVTGAYFNLKNKKLTYGISGGGSLSQQYHHLGEDVFGYKYNFNISKLSGSLTYGIDYYEESKTYDPNDLGILFAPNERVLGVYSEYSSYKEWWKFNSMGGGVYFNYNRLHTPNRYAGFGIDGWFWSRTKSLWQLNAWTYVAPFETHDYFEPRTEGRYYALPSNYNLGTYIGSDNRKKYSFWINTNYRTYNEPGRYRFNWSYGQRYRFSDKFSLGLQTYNNNFIKDVGFADNVDDDIIFGKRKYITVENVLSGSYIFNHLMSLSLRLRHNWGKVHYNSFHLLGDEGQLLTTNYDSFNDVDFNAFNVDMVYTWRFAPGSDLSVVWKNAVLGSESDPTKNYSDLNYFQATNGLFEMPQTNSLSLRIVYYLDYVNFKKKSNTK
jgi:hypothetical protein